MTKKEILQYNKMCAEFLGGEVLDVIDRIYINKMKDDELIFHNTSVDSNTYEWNSEKNMHYIPFDMLQFNSDWNWIMEIIKAINMIPNPKNPSDTTLQTKRTSVQSLLRSANQEAVVQEINQFLIWYNKNK